MDGHFRKVRGMRVGEMHFPNPVPTFRERLGSEVPILKSAADRFSEFAQNHPINREPREKMERNTPHERMETPAQERYEHQRGRAKSRVPSHLQPFTVGAPNYSMSDFLPHGMAFGTGSTFDDISYGKPRSKRKQRRY